MRPSGRWHSKAVSLAFGGSVALGAGVRIGRFVYTPILPAMVEALNLSKAHAGLIASANFFGYLLGSLAAASPRLPGTRRGWLIGASALGAATTAAMGFGDAMWEFVLLRFFGGAASALVLVLASALVLERLAGWGREQLAGLHFAGVGSGIALSAAMIAALGYVGADWRWLWCVSGVASAAALPVVIWLVPPQTPQVKGAQPVAQGPSTGGLVPLVWAYGLFGFGYVVTGTFLVAIVRGDVAARSIEPWVWVVVGVAAAPSVAVWNALSLRVGLTTAFAAACLAEAVGVAASVLWQGRAGILVASFLLGATMVGITALGLQAARRIAGPGAQKALGLMTAAFSVGQIVGPLLAGWLSDRTGSFVLASIVAAGALVVSAVITLFFVPLGNAAR